MWIEISKAKDWPGIGRGYNVRLEGMKYPTTMYAKDGTELERKIERVQQDFSNPNLLMFPDSY